MQGKDERSMAPHHGRHAARAVLALLLVVAGLVVLPATAPPVAAAEAPPALELIGQPFDPVSVAPPPTSVLWDPVPVKRDCGFSVELTGGRALWIFCDTTNVDASRRFTWFFQNTAAFAYPDAPTVMREATDSKGRPYQLITPLPSYDPCVGVYDGDRHVIWPSSATRVPGAYGRDRVLIWFTNYCYEPGAGTLGAFIPISMGVADLLVDPTDPAPHTKQQRARVLNPNLWSLPADQSGGFGEASVFGRDGHVYLYHCNTTMPGCQVARVSYAEVEDPTAYRYRSETGTWGTSPPSVPTLELPGVVPDLSFNVVYLPDWDLYALGAMAEAGTASRRVAVRVAHTPTGPFSDPVLIENAVDCKAQDFPVSCYAGNVHSQLSTVDSLGVGFYDLHFHHERGGQIRAFGARVYIDPPPEGACYSGFSDVDSPHPFCPEVRWFAQQGITTGYTDGSFKPTRAVSRQAMAAWFYRAAGSPPGPFPDPGFSDLDPSSAFYTEIAWFAQQGITTGYADGTYRPAANVSRQAMSAWFYRWAGRPVGPFPDPGFSDVDPGNPFYTPISWFAQAGITTGFSDGTFRPLSNVSRQAIAAFFFRYLGGS